MSKTFRALLLLPLFLVLSNFSLLATGIEFFHGSWEEAIALAKADDKPIFVDAFTTWCGPCKRMAATVFTDESVGAFFNENFVCLKLDMEKEEGIKFQQKYPVSAFPTLYFIDNEGKTIQHVKGAQPVDKFIDLGKAALGKIDKSGDFAEQYDAGNRDPELIVKYIKALNKAGKPSGKIANDYLNSQEDMTSDFNLRFLLTATTEADSRIFDLLIDHRSQVAALESVEAVDEVLAQACEKTVQKAIEFNSPDLLAEAKDKMKNHLPAQASTFALEADMRYYRGQKDAKNYVKTCNSYVKKVAKNNAAQLHALSKDIYGNFDGDATAMKLAEKYAQQAAENGGLAHYYTNYASILYHNKKKADALAMAKKALEMAKGNPRDEAESIQLIRQIERED